MIPVPKIKKRVPYHQGCTEYPKQTQSTARYISIDLGGDATTNGMSKTLATILGAFVDFERSRIAQRISEVKQDQKGRGFWVGGVAPFGIE